MAALVLGGAIQDGLVGDLLQIEIERGVDAEAGPVDFFGAVILFELLADLFDEVRSDAVGRLLDFEGERLGHGGGRLGGRDLSVVLHLAEDEIAAAEGALRTAKRRVVFGPFGQGGKER